MAARLALRSTPKELQTFTKNEVAPYKYPRSIEFVEDLPKTNSGKIRRVELRDAEIEKYKDQALAWKLAGAGGGGYLILISDKPIEGTMRINIRRKEVL